VIEYVYNYFREVIIVLIKPSIDSEGDLVLMSIETYQYREEMLDLRGKLLSAEANRLSGAKTYSIDEVSERLRGLEVLS